MGEEDTTLPELSCPAMEPTKEVPPTAAELQKDAPFVYPEPKDTCEEQCEPSEDLLDSVGLNMDFEGDHPYLAVLGGVGEYPTLPEYPGVPTDPCDSGDELPARSSSAPLLETKFLSDSCSFTLPMSPPGYGYVEKANLSESNSMIMPICRICHMPEEESNDLLISPCRCSGSLAYIHNRCLMRWLEITSRKSRKPPKCELCHYQYHRHKKFKFHHWHLPRITPQDKILHLVFIINLLIMIGCAIATVMCFLSDNGQVYQNFPKHKVDLTTEEIITLSCGVLFFVSFFIAMSVQIKAKHTIYQLFVKFVMQNMEWEIDEYDKSKDSLFKPPILV